MVNPRVILLWKMALRLSQQISSLCDPTPSLKETYDWSDDDESKAKLCTYNEEEEESNEQAVSHRVGKKRRSSLRKDAFEADPKYAGKPVSRKVLGQTWEIGGEYVLLWRRDVHYGSLGVYNLNILHVYFTYWLYMYNKGKRALIHERVHVRDFVGTCIMNELMNWL